MKKRCVVIFSACVIGLILSCNSGSDNKKTPGNEVVIPPPDNNSATNPSSADTAFAKDTSYLRKDSLQKK